MNTGSTKLSYHMNVTKTIANENAPSEWNSTQRNFIAHNICVFFSFSFLLAAFFEVFSFLLL